MQSVALTEVLKIPIKYSKSIKNVNKKLGTYWEKQGVNFLKNVIHKSIFVTLACFLDIMALATEKPILFNHYQGS